MSHKGGISMDGYVTVSKEAADKIRDMIFIEKRFAPGSKLPNEKELMKELRISRTSLREAIKILIANKILYIKRGTGTFVCDFDGEAESIFNVFYPVKNMAMVKNSFELRLILEPEMAFQSMEYVKDEDIELLKKLEEECRIKILNNEDYTEEDKNFHAAIARLSKNRIFEELLPYFYVSIASTEGAKNLSKKEADYVIRQLNENAVIYHNRILENFIKGDALGVRISMETHIYNSLRIFNDLIAVKPKLADL